MQAPQQPLPVPFAIYADGWMSEPWFVRVVVCEAAEVFAFDYVSVVTKQNAQSLF